MTRPNEADVAIVGGGPAGAALAIRLADAGRHTVFFERQPRQRWRASGVYSSPLTRARLAQLGLRRTAIGELCWPITATVVLTSDGRAACTLEHTSQPACGVDRVRLEEALLARAREAGADVREGAAVLKVELGARRPQLTVADGNGHSVWNARAVVGADGPGSIVARAAGVARPIRRLRRAGVTGHRADPRADVVAEHVTRIIIGAGWYLGIAPVPDRRANLGLVISEADFRRSLAAGNGLTGVMDAALARCPPQDRSWQTATPTDRLTAQLPLAHRVTRSSGRAFVLVGDAAGFIDPLSGEGLYRALVSAELAGHAIDRWLSGEPDALSDYDHRLRARFRSKDFVSWLLQAFLFRPDLAAYALERLDRRKPLRRSFVATLSDALPGSTVLDPRFLGRLLVP